LRKSCYLLYSTQRLLLYKLEHVIVKDSVYVLKKAFNHFFNHYLIKNT